MSKILKNTTGSDISIADTGITIAASPATYTISPTDYLLWAASDNIITEIGSGTIIVNDGSVDLGISDGTDLIKGLFPSNIDVNTSPSNPVITKSSNSDVFGRTRVSEVNTIFDYNFSNVVDFDLYWSTIVENGATLTHYPDDAGYRLSVSTAVGSKAILQSRRHMEYNTGKSHIAYFTGNPNSIQQGMRKRLGLFTGGDGYFFEATDTGLRFVIRKNGTDTKIERTDWNGDKTDGTGDSGITGDLTKQKLFFIEIGWLGALGVKFGQIIDGKKIIMHFHQVANREDTSYTSTAVLPFRIEMERIATAPVADFLTLSCFSYMYEGKRNDTFKIRTWESGTSTVTVNTSEDCIFGIRINSSYGEAAIKLEEAIINLTSGNSEIRWRLLYNPTINGTPTWDDEPFSIAQTLNSPTSITYSGGFVAASGYISIGSLANVNLRSTDLVLGHDVDHNFDTFLLVAQTLSSNSKILTSINWEEFS